MYHLNLIVFPEAIAEAEKIILNINCQLDICKEQLWFMDAEIEAEIAGNKELKNEQQRKMKRLELQQEPDYLDRKCQLKKIKEQLDRENIKLNLLRNQFTVAKLEARKAIADLEAVA